MIEDLRFVEREVFIPHPELGGKFTKRETRRILQARIGGQWADVPLVPTDKE